MGRFSAIWGERSGEGGQKGRLWALGSGLWALGKKGHAPGRCGNRQARTPAPRFLPGRSYNAVVMTFITGDFSRVPWTKAVQGENFLKLFLTAKNAASTRARKKTGHLNHGTPGRHGKKPIFNRRKRRKSGFGRWALGCRGRETGQGAVTQSRFPGWKPRRDGDTETAGDLFRNSSRRFLPDQGDNWNGGWPAGCSDVAAPGDGCAPGAGRGAGKRAKVSIGRHWHEISC